MFDHIQKQFADAFKQKDFYVFRKMGCFRLCYEVYIQPMPGCHEAGKPLQSSQNTAVESRGAEFDCKRSGYVYGLG